MNRIRPGICVLAGATIGLFAGAAVYGAISSSLPVLPRAANASMARGRAVAAHCAAGQSLQHGVCIIHLVPAVVVQAPRSPSRPAVTKPASHEAESGDDSPAHATAKGD
jgi:hypothetical protein